MISLLLNLQLISLACFFKLKYEFLIIYNILAFSSTQETVLRYENIFLTARKHSNKQTTSLTNNVRKYMQ